MPSQTLDQGLMKSFYKYKKPLKHVAVSLKSIYYKQQRHFCLYPMLGCLGLAKTVCWYFEGGWEQQQRHFCLYPMLGCLGLAKTVCWYF